MADKKAPEPTKRRGDLTEVAEILGQFLTMQLWFALASLVSVAALNSGIHVQPRMVNKAAVRVVPRMVSNLEQDKTNGFQEFALAAGVTTLRVCTCALMVHHGFDKIQNVDGFSANVVAKFFGFLLGDPHFWTLSAAATQIAGAGLLSVGILARPVALSMMATMAA